MSQRKNKKVYYHLPGLFEFYELYCVFLPLYKEHREYFYDWCEISSIYGSPADCLWGGGRAGFGSDNPEEVLKLTQEYGISARLTFSNSLLRKEHLTDKKCNILCKMFEEVGEKRNGVIVHSDLLLKYLAKIIYVFLTIFLYLLKCPQSLILSALRAFCFCGKPHISRSIFLYFRYQAWLKSW